MSLLYSLLLGALVTLVVINMARPRFRRRRLSAAAFFRHLDPAEAKRRLAWGNPFRSRPLYPQLAILGFLAATLLATHSCRLGVKEQVGLRVLVDTSYSMTTTSAGETRLQAARREVLRFLDRVEEASGTLGPCLELSAFDLELRPIQTGSVDRATFERSLRSLGARALGTDLSLLRRLVDGEAEDPESELRPDSGCETPYRLVVSDLPAPDWIGGPGSRWIWRDVGQPVSNVGLVGIGAARDPFGGRIESVIVEVATFGPPTAGVQFRSRSPAGRQDIDQAIDWPPTGAWRYELQDPDPGRHHLRITPGGAYGGDDEAWIVVPERGGLRVSWRLPDATLGRRMGFELTSQNPDLTVIPLGEEPRDSPTLVVGNHYRRRATAQIGFFSPQDPLLEGLNFDVAERAGILGIAPPPGFEPVLAGTSLAGDVWIARRHEPPGVYVPGLPTGGESAAGHFSALLFVQSLRWLLSKAPPPALYALTSVAQPEPEGSRLALHDGEGRTDYPVVSLGDVETIQPVLTRRPPRPTWPWWLAGAAVVLLLEQVLLAYGGEAWR